MFSEYANILRDPENTQWSEHTLFKGGLGSFLDTIWSPKPCHEHLSNIYIYMDLPKDTSGSGSNSSLKIKKENLTCLKS